MNRARGRVGNGHVEEPHCKSRWWWKRKRTASQSQKTLSNCVCGGRGRESRHGRFVVDAGELTSRMPESHHSCSRRREKDACCVNLGLVADPREFGHPNRATDTSENTRRRIHVGKIHYTKSTSEKCQNVYKIVGHTQTRYVRELSEICRKDVRERHKLKQLRQESKQSRQESRVETVASGVEYEWNRKWSNMVGVAAVVNEHQSMEGANLAIS